MSWTTVTVLLSGPPLVRMKNWSKARSEPVTQRMSASASAGLRSGSVTRRSCCQRPAPSMAAASLTSSGMACKPTSRIEHVEAHVLPDDEQRRREERRERCPEVGQRRVDEADGLEDRVDGADGRRVEAPREQRGGREADRDWDEDGRPQQPGPASAFLHEEREAQAHPDEEDRGEDRVRECERRQRRP